MVTLNKWYTRVLPSMCSLSNPWDILNMLYFTRTSQMSLGQATKKSPPGLAESADNFIFIID